MNSDLFVDTSFGKLPLLFVFDLDYTLWPLWVDTLEPPFKAVPSELYMVEDKNNYEIKLYPNVPHILNFIKKNIPGSKIAVASRTDKPKWAREILSLMSFPAQPKGETIVSLSEIIDFAEIYPGSKLTHMSALRDKSGISYEDMIFFDDEIRNSEVEQILGVKFVLASDYEGLTIRTFMNGLKEFGNDNQ
ncbi:9598_t:CDS:2 [Ambispora gerdemannii]|uniref:9598_t:CDS:1 n=1 Tax=Ambispora gerdemannii TaxID=144530 RepID=A0A9N8V1I0_9GLOM|nr:9598_t:CDS:2 [Ambispora gerdemannii]